MKFLYILLSMLTLTYGILIAQDDLISLNGFKNLKNQDKLIIDYKNMNCRTTSGDRLIIYLDKDAFTVLRFVDFHMGLIIDSIELNDDAKQIYRQSHGNFETAKLTKDEFYELMKNFEELGNSKHDKCIVIAGFYSEFCVQLNETVITRRFRCPIEMKNLGDIKMIHFEK